MSTLHQKYAAAGQEQVFKFAKELSKDELNQLETQLAGIDPERINSIVKKAKQAEADANHSVGQLEPLPEESQSTVIGQKDETINEWRSIGTKAVQEGKVAALLLAGGQGTRLGSSAPKGCYDIGLPSHKSLFQLQAERIAKLGGDKIVWYIMTSGPTRKPTEDFFQQNKFFGLKESNVIFFEQGVLPCVSMDGKILLDSKSKVAVAPDGNGGVYNALANSGVIDDMKKRGIEHIHMYCVDNSLVKVADPTFLGFSISKNVDIATKVVRKRSANESVGLIVSKDGKPMVIEYSEIPEELAAAKDPADAELLKLRAANIVNHYYTFSFLEKSAKLAEEGMPFHIAKKKIPTVDAEGNPVKPEKPNGIKYEQFVFDIFPMVPMNKFASLEVERNSEFSPVKNGPGSGEDCPETARQDLMAEGERWLQKAGAKVDHPVEISPEISYDGSGLEKYSGAEIAEDYLK